MQFQICYLKMESVCDLKLLNIYPTHLCKTSENFTYPGREGQLPETRLFENTTQ